MKTETAKATTSNTNKKAHHISIDSTILANIHSAFFVASNQPQTQTSTKKVPSLGRYDIILFETKN